ncbi:MAG: rhomboid family intramembrane serine protease [Anaerolineales bacterium]|nr:rhomboid family intramembrane serine protease [Anaerolineales bacterium]
MSERPEDTAPELNSEAPQPLGRIRPRRVPIRMPQRKPIVVFSILAVTALVYLLQTLTASGFLDLGQCSFFLSPDLPACFGMKVNPLIVQGQWWRLITPILLHASLVHIAFNMYALYALGPELERMFGHFSFFALYLVSGFAGNVLSFVMSDAASLGASSAVFGLLAAHAVFAYRNQRVFGQRAQAVMRSILQIAAINFIIGLSPGIDNWGHFGGLLGGLVFTYLSGPVFELQEQGERMKLVDTNTPNQVWLGVLAVLLIFGAAAAGKLLA